MTRQQNFRELLSLDKTFESYFSALGYVWHQPVSVTSSIDPTVRFVGSHTSVMKPYIDGASLPPEGYAMIQPCLKTKNLPAYAQPEQSLAFASYYACHGLFFTYAKLDQATEQTLKYLRQHLQTPAADLRVCLTAADDDLVDSVKHAGAAELVETDTLPAKRYRHQYGMLGITGRNLHIVMRDKTTGAFTSIAVIVVIEKNGKPEYAEVAISPSGFVKQRHGLAHTLDCYPIYVTPAQGTATELRKLEDTLMTVSLLYEEGLRPSAQHNRNRLLKQYLQAMDRQRQALGLSVVDLERSLDAFAVAFNQAAQSNAKQIVQDMGFSGPGQSTATAGFAALTGSQLASVQQLHRKERRYENS